jgi:hypothetical protein
VYYNDLNYEIIHILDGFHELLYPVLDPDPKPQATDPDPNKSFGSLWIRIHNSGLYTKCSIKLKLKYMGFGNTVFIICI